MLRDTLEKMKGSLLHRRPDANHLLAPGVFTADQYLQLHRNNIFVSLTEALASIYPVVEELVGRDFFVAACREFIPAFSPKAAPMLDFGKEFARFLERYEPASSLVYLPEVAQLEWAWHESFHAADAPAFDSSKLEKMNESQQASLQFALHPAIRLLRTDYPVHRIWLTNQQAYRGDDRVNLDDGGDLLLIKRPRLEVMIESIESAEWTFLQSIAVGVNLETALDRACAVDPVFDLQTVLIHRVSDSTLVNSRQ